MAGRPKIFSEKEVIDKAIEVFWRVGYEAASAEELLKAMGIGKGSFYLAFKGGKRELFERSLVQFSAERLANLKRAISVSDNPIQLIKDFFLSIADTGLAKHMNGCYLGNAIAEMANIDAALQNIAINLLKEMEVVFTSVIRQAQDDQELKSTEKPDILARYLINLWNGINISRRMYTDKFMLKEMISFQLQVIK
ncbi:MAG: transcriptional regulator, TetR family [Mucilaginibacter sp.]|nr:transcriptional regulator, TetR family [Mucilaginibacter sp.]